MDAVDYEFPVDAKVSMTFPSPRPRGCCEDYAAYFDHLLLDGGRTVPHTVEKAIEAFKNLVESSKIQIKRREYTIT